MGTSPLFLEATAGFEPAIGVLQTPALPLGYVAQPARFYRKGPSLSKRVRWVRLTSPLVGIVRIPLRNPRLAALWILARRVLLRHNELASAP
jgi:hypothetical protein